MGATWSKSWPDC